MTNVTASNQDQMKIENRTSNPVESFSRFQHYMKASQSETPDDKCKNCTFLFTHKGKTMCYAYEQQLIGDKLEFNPRRDFNCDLFDDTGEIGHVVEAYKRALAKRPDPENDPDYKKCLEEDNKYCDSLRSFENNFSTRKSDDREEWDDPGSYACCSDWEDEPESCYHCADDECPMNRS